MALLYLLAGSHDGAPRASDEPAASRCEDRRQVVERLEIEKAWLVDPVSGTRGPGRDRRHATASSSRSCGWRARRQRASTTRASSSRPVSSTCTPISASPASRTRRPSPRARRRRLTAATRPWPSCRTRQPALDEPGVLERIRAAARASGSPVEVLAYGAVSADRAGEQLSAMGELADAGVVGYSDDGAPVRTPQAAAERAALRRHARPGRGRSCRGPGADVRRGGQRGLRGLGHGPGRLAGRGRGQRRLAGHSRPGRRPARRAASPAPPDSRLHGRRRSRPSAGRGPRACP